MAIVRTYDQRDIMLITDFPLVKEAESGNPYSEHSSTQLKDALIKASIIECKHRTNKHIIGANEICLTYLSLTRPIKGDGDWAKSICSKKQIPSDETDNYIQCEWLKDVYITKEIHKNLQGLVNQIEKVQPKLVVMAGKWSFLLLTSLFDDSTAQLATIAGTKTTFKKKIYFGALNKYRASLLTFHAQFNLPPTVVVPILTHSYQWVVKDKVVIIQRDYLKIAKVYRRLKEGATVEEVLTNTRKFLYPVDSDYIRKHEIFYHLKQLLAKLNDEPIKVCFDVETRQQGIDCIGICYEYDRSLTIPFTELYHETVTTKGVLAWTSKTVNGKKSEIQVEMPIGSKVRKYRHFWNVEAEAQIMQLLQEIMLHKNCLHVGQNYLYDSQFFFREWKLKVHAYADTMIQHHVLFNYMAKDLATLASMYCDDYVYWKDEIDSINNYDRWRYNGKDVCYTLSIENILSRMLKASDPKLLSFYNFQQQEVCKHITELMNRGVPVDTKLKDEMLKQFAELMQNSLDLYKYVFNEPDINPNSVTQIKSAFKDLLGIKPLINRKTKAESFGADAMLVYLEEYPEWRTILTLFLEYKSIKVFVNTFLSAKVSVDENMRCSYNVAGTKTYRLSSRKNIDGGGLNLQNIPSKGKIKLHYALQELATKEDDTEELPDYIDEDYEGTIELPNCKRMFVPPKDYIFFDGDYSAIDLMFVIWESNCKFLKDVVKSGQDVYSMLASEYYGREISKKDGERQIFKAVCHATNYLGRPTTIAAKAGLSVPQVKKVQDFYFRMCPEILAWHRRLEHEARTNGYITNIFGARCWATDTTDPMWLNKLVAWQPQSSAGILVNKALCALEDGEKNNEKGIRVLMQVHDSIAGVFHKADTTAEQRIVKYMEQTIPYEDQLVIPAAIKTSSISYGDCK